MRDQAQPPFASLGGFVALLHDHYTIIIHA